MTNALKAGVIAFANAVLGCVTAFGVHLTDYQQATLIALINSGFGLWVAFTYKNSPTYIPKPPPLAPADPPETKTGP